MNDVRALLSEVVSEDLRSFDRWPDAEPDIVRGRALLVRRRRRRFALAGGSGVVAVAVVGVLFQAGVPGGRSVPVAGATSASARAAVALVAYQGAQPRGYVLKSIPQGWEVASADDIALVLHKVGTPRGGTNEDKILIEGDLNPFPKSGDQAVEVNGHRGWFFGGKSAGHSVTLIFKTGQRKVAGAVAGKANPSRAGLAGTPLNVLVQLPHSLNWNVETLVKFASGITVANDAGGAAG